MQAMHPREHIIYQDSTVTITTTRAILGGVTYSMANITSVRSFTEQRPLIVVLLGVLLLLLGYACADANFTGLSTGLFASGTVSVIAFFGLKPKHWVRIGTAGAESNAIWSRDPKWTATVVAAINQAMVARG